MFTIKAASEVNHNNLVDVVDYINALIQNNLEFERLNDYKDKGVLLKYFENVNEFCKSVYSDEKLEVMREQTIPGLENVFSVDIAKERIKADVMEITTKLIAKLRAEVVNLELSYSNYDPKIKQIVNILAKAKEDLKMLVDAGKYYNQSFESKTELLKSNQEYLVKAYGGKLFFNHSVQSLLNVVNAVLDTMFKEEELNKGRTISKALNFEMVNNSIKYFVGRNEVAKVDSELGLKVDKEKFKEAYEGLPEVHKSDANSVVELLGKVFQPNPNVQPDNAAPHATLFDGLCQKVMGNWSKADMYFQSNIKALLESTSNTKLLPLLDICTNLEAAYKEYRDDVEANQDKVNLVSQYLKLLSTGVTATYYELECRAYDVLRYISQLDYLMFFKNLCLLMYLTFRNKGREKLNMEGMSMPADTQKQAEESLTLQEEKDIQQVEEGKQPEEGEVPATESVEDPLLFLNKFNKPKPTNREIDNVEPGIESYQAGLEFFGMLKNTFGSKDMLSKNSNNLPKALKNTEKMLEWWDLYSDNVELSFRVCRSKNILNNIAFPDPSYISSGAVDTTLGTFIKSHSGCISGKNIINFVKALTNLCESLIPNMNNIKKAATFDNCKDVANIIQGPWLKAREALMKLPFAKGYIVDFKIPKDTYIMGLTEDKVHGFYRSYDRNDGDDLEAFVIKKWDDVRQIRESNDIVSNWKKWTIMDCIGSTDNICESANNAVDDIKKLINAYKNSKAACDEAEKIGGNVKYYVNNLCECFDLAIVYLTSTVLTLQTCYGESLMWYGVKLNIEGKYDN